MMDVPLSPDLGADFRIGRIDGGGMDFATFAFSRRRPMLAVLERPWIAIGARWRGMPVGLAVGGIGTDGAWLESVMVAPALRRRGIGIALLLAFEDAVRTAVIGRIDAQYSSFLKSRTALEALLARRGWASPRIVDITLVGLAGAMADGGGAWRPVQRAMRELTEYRVERYNRDNLQDDAAIDALLASAPELGVSDPRANAAIDPEISIVLRHHDRLIGWIAAERLTRSLGTGTLVPDAPSIYYSSARFADGHHKALMLVGYHHAFSRQAERYGPASRAVYRTHPAASAMYAFTRARFEPMALHVEERLCASLFFEPTATAAKGAAPLRLVST